MPRRPPRGEPPQTAPLSGYITMKTTILRVFPSQLGWMALLTTEQTVRHLTFGHATAAAAQNAVRKFLGEAEPHTPSIILEAIAISSRHSQCKHPSDLLVSRLQTYAEGSAEIFQDIRVDLGTLSEFQQQILNLCRKIPYGSTFTYAELAARGGNPLAARAVGNCMARNPIPLIIPCHRVVCANGRIGNYSAIGGSVTKRRLLEMEARFIQI